MSQQEIKLLKDNRSKHLETIDIASVTIEDPAKNGVLKLVYHKSQTWKSNCCRECELGFDHGILLSILLPNPHSQCLYFGCKK